MLSKTRSSKVSLLLWVVLILSVGLPTGYFTLAWSQKTPIQIEVHKLTAASNGAPVFDVTVTNTSAYPALFIGGIIYGRPIGEYGSPDSVNIEPPTRTPLLLKPGQQLKISSSGSPIFKDWLKDKSFRTTCIWYPHGGATFEKAILFLHRHLPRWLARHVPSGKWRFTHRPVHLP